MHSQGGVASRLQRKIALCRIALQRHQASICNGSMHITVIVAGGEGVRKWSQGMWGLCSSCGLLTCLPAPPPLAREVCAKCEIMRFGKVRELGDGSVVSVNVIF